MRGKDQDPELQGIIPRVDRYIYEEKAMNPSVQVKIANVHPRPLHCGAAQDGRKSQTDDCIGGKGDSSCGV